MLFSSPLLLLLIVLLLLTLSRISPPLRTVHSPPHLVHDSGNVLKCMQTRLRIEQWEMLSLLETPPMCCFQSCRSQELVPVDCVPIVRHTKNQLAILLVEGEPEHWWPRGQSGTPTDMTTLWYDGEFEEETCTITDNPVVWWRAWGRSLYHHCSVVAGENQHRYRSALLAWIQASTVLVVVHCNIFEPSRFPE